MICETKRDSTFPNKQSVIESCKTTFRYNRHEKQVEIFQFIKKDIPARMLDELHVFIENQLIRNLVLEPPKIKACLRYFYIFYQKKVLKKHVKCVLFYWKRSFRSQNIQVCVLPSSPVFPCRSLVNLQ